MKYVLPPYRIFPLGDSAICIDFGNTIDKKINQQVLAMFHHLSQQPLPGLIEAVPAYSSLAIYYNLPEVVRKKSFAGTAFDWLKGEIEKLLSGPLHDPATVSSMVKIPVCYDFDFGPDLDEIGSKNQLSREEIISIHTGSLYRVYMLGFLPGFCYLGELDERISFARKEKPMMVPAGSIGIAGRQTGIYPLTSPGGWQIIGRTPLKIFDAGKNDPALLKAGDSIQFISISKNEFANY